MTKRRSHTQPRATKKSAAKPAKIDVTDDVRSHVAAAAVYLDDAPAKLLEVFGSLAPDGDRGLALEALCELAGLLDATRMELAAARDAFSPDGAS